jgi:hypothetical protein
MAISNNILPSAITESYSQKFGYLLGKNLKKFNSYFEKKSAPITNQIDQSVEKITTIDPKRKKKTLIGGGLFIASLAALSLAGAYPVVFGVAALGLLTFKVANTPNWKKERNELAQEIHSHYSNNQVDLTAFFNDYLSSRKNSDLKHIHLNPSDILEKYKDKPIHSILQNSEFNQHSKSEIKKNMKFVALGSVAALTGLAIGGSVIAPVLIGAGGAFAIKSLVKTLGQKISFSKTSKTTNKMIENVLKSYQIDSKNIQLSEAEKILPGISKVIELEQNGFQLNKKDISNILNAYRNQTSKTDNKPKI